MLNHCYSVKAARFVRNGRWQLYSAGATRKEYEHQACRSLKLKENGRNQEVHVDSPILIDFSFKKWKEKGHGYFFVCFKSHLFFWIREYFYSQNVLLLLSSYSVFTNFRLKIIDQSPREVFIYWTLVDRREWGGEWGKEKKIWLKHSETRNSVRAQRTVTLSLSLADGSISSG